MTAAAIAHSFIIIRALLGAPIRIFPLYIPCPRGVRLVLWSLNRVRDATKRVLSIFYHIFDFPGSISVIKTLMQSRNRFPREGGRREMYQRLATTTGHDRRTRIMVYNILI